MKKLITLVLVGGMFAFYACGPSAEEKAKKEQATQDSIVAADAKVAEEAAAAAKVAEEAAAAAKVAEEAAAAAKVAEEAAAKGKGKGKPKPVVVKPVVVKPGEGRGK